MTKRKSPYLWATLITKILSGEQSCLFQSWLPANFEDYAKMPSNFNSAAWNVAHTKMINALVKERQDLGETVSVENENKFTYQTKKGIAITIKPDIITLKSGMPMIWDTKTGKSSASHIIQVQLAMWLAPYCLAVLKGTVPDGIVAYTDHRVNIPPESVNDKFKKDVTDLVETLTNPTAPAASPSYAECRWCSLSKASCEKRFDQGQSMGTGEL